MRIKQSIVIGIIIVIISVFACATENNNVQAVRKLNISYWQQKSPKLINMAGYSKLVESDSGNGNVSSNESKDMYIGKVNNPYGIRDDVLDFIMNYFSNNESTTYAAIRMEQTVVKMYYAGTGDEAVNISNNGEIAIWCLGNIIGSVGVNKYLDGLEEIRLNTNEGKKMDKDARQKLGWKVLGNHMSIEQMNLICNRGNY